MFSRPATGSGYPRSRSSSATSRRYRGRSASARSRLQSRLSESDTDNTSTDEAEEDTECKREREQGNLYVYPLLRIAVSGLSGMLFGIALEKGRVFEPQVIRDQMLFRKFVMMKMFLSATATSVISFSLLHFIPVTMKALKQAMKMYVSAIKMKTVLAAVVGAGILGTGMTLSGSCPGLVLVQVGAGIFEAVYTLAGLFIGGFLYALTHSLVVKVFLDKRKNNVYFFTDYFETDYVSLAIPLVIILSIVIAGCEYFFPWDTEVEVPAEPVGFMKAKAWPSIIAGILIGTLQIPVILANQDTLGTTTGYVTMASQVLVVKPLKRVMGHLKRFRWGWGNWWQVFFVGGAILGSFLSSHASNSWGSVTGPNKWQAFGGGILMIYGARLAGGCTSGHGLSGLGLMAMLSFAAVPAMFGGAIGTALLLRLLGLPEFQ